MPLDQVILPRFGKEMVSLLLVAGFIAIALPARAAGLYEISGIKLDATAETANQAKDIALQQGRADAFQALMDRLTLQKERNRRPKPNRNQLDGLITALEISNEKRSQTRYLGDLAVTFDRNAVRNLLAGSGLTMSETQARPALILPILSLPEGKDMWSPANPWRIALATQENVYRLLPVSQPVGDLDDMNVLPLQNALAGAPERLTILKRRYDASYVMIATATPTGPDPLQPTGLVVDYEILEDVGLVRRRLQIRSNAADEGLGALLVRGAARLAATLNEDWIARTRLDLNARGKIAVVARYKSFQDWLTLQSRLEAVTVLRRHDIESLRKSEARLTLTHYGNRDQVITAFAQSNLTLSEQEGFWTLKLRQ